MIFLVNLDDFFAIIYTDFHEVVVSTRYVPFIYRPRLLVYVGLVDNFLHTAFRDLGVSVSTFIENKWLCSS